MRLKGDNIDRNRVLESPIGRHDAYKEGNRKQKDKMVELLAKWRRFVKSPTGRVVAAICDPEIAECKRVLSLTGIELKNELQGRDLSRDDIHSYRDEIRG